LGWGAYSGLPNQYPINHSIAVKFDLSGDGLAANLNNTSGLFINAASGSPMMGFNPGGQLLPGTCPPRAAVAQLSGP
jgi:hypothetical protein